MLWGGTRVPITLLGGVLGSGKTTLLNRLLSEAGGRRLVVLVNDVGDIAVDAALIASATDDVIELTNGCVCCSMTDGLGMALEDLRRLDDPPDQIIVELSGVAEPARVAPWASTAGFRLDGIVICVDTERIERQLTDRWMADTVRAQLAAADLVVFTKIDRSGSVPDLGRHTSAPTLDGRELLLDALLAVERPEDHPALHTSTAAEPVAWSVASVDIWHPVDVESLRRSLSELSPEVIRVKGFVDDGAGDTWIVQGVGSRRTVVRVVDGLEIEQSSLGLVGIASPDLVIADLENALCALADQSRMHTGD